ncbi:hypothetical protein [Rhodopseudomonas palustris]|uniref:hypothetical protein n=1 Tax=Rhodopseudomonas palustris TaxID=1076 RepID=UPI000CEC308C|nr:hypothetical protein [Rhodopseudomonas palustris]PPQ44122.1 hypothetical protein CKO39_07755 [Rhodopseudomonas palustris]
MFANRSSPEVVRHVPHRWLISQWTRMGALPDPTMAAFGFEPASIDLTRSVITRVVPIRDAARFLILHFGSQLAEAVSVDDAQGRHLDEILAPPTRDHILAQYELCRRGRKPVYSIACTTDVHDVPVEYEKLLLPFINNHGEVVSILATTLLISTEGRFERDGIFAHGDFPPPSAVVVYSIDVPREDHPHAVASV